MTNSRRPYRKIKRFALIDWIENIDSKILVVLEKKNMFSKVVIVFIDFARLLSSRQYAIRTTITYDFDSKI